ncbi:MAG TPA: hypothetical protein PK018_10695 [Candidatus Competibacter sp.]|nr:hypothetical protein [Candidatus Competibacteraceae bacterium]HPE72614.1 hypothetical protein [Candidatus Competibacter sp.]
MKTTFTAAAFALTLGLSSLAHAGFNDQGPTLDTRSASASQRQDLSPLPTISGFNQKSHPAAAGHSALPEGPRMALGAHCALPRQSGFQNSASYAKC